MPVSNKHGLVINVICVVGLDVRFVFILIHHLMAKMEVVSYLPQNIKFAKYQAKDRDQLAEKFGEPCPCPALALTGCIAWAQTMPLLVSIPSSRLNPTQSSVTQ